MKTNPELERIINDIKAGKIDPMKFIMDQLGDRKFTPDKLNEFSMFAKSNGASQSEIDMVMKMLGR